MAMVAEAELGVLFVKAKEAAALQVMLEELRHLQPATLIQVNNSTAYGIVNSSIRQQRSKAIDMQFYWVQNCKRQGQFRVYWEPGRNNKADYFKKHHPQAHHKKVNGIQNPKLGLQGRTRNPATSRVITRKESGIWNL
eukprot:3777915-Ditylum_brightwellii.AAC.1